MSRWIAVGCVVMGLGVALGAFGAHALRDMVEPASLQTWETANRYHIYHGLGMILLAVAKAGRWPMILMLAGLVLFSGSLYALALTGIGFLGAITPLGGAAWITAWIWSAVLFFRKPTT